MMKYEVVITRKAGPVQAMYAVVEVTDYSYTQTTYTVDAYGRSSVYDYWGIMKDVEFETMEISNAIEELPSVELATFDDLPLVREVSKKYNAATNVVLSKISLEHVEKLKALVEKLDMETVQVVQFVQEKIDKITNVTVDSLDEINQIEKFYNALTLEEKELVDNTKLFEAKIKVVEFQIDAIIPGSSNFKKKVKEASESYNSLTSSQKAYVANYSKLQNYLAQINDENKDVNSNENQDNKNGCGSMIDLTGVALLFVLSATVLVMVSKRRGDY